MSQFDWDIAYIKGDNNCIADALSCWPLTKLEWLPDHHEVWANTAVNMVLSVITDAAVLANIQLGYKSDPFCQKQKWLGSETSMVYGILDHGWLFSIIMTYRKTCSTFHTTAWAILDLKSICHPLRLLLLAQYVVWSWNGLYSWMHQLSKEQIEDNQTCGTITPFTCIWQKGGWCGNQFDWTIIFGQWIWHDLLHGQPTWIEHPVSPNCYYINCWKNGFTLLWPLVLWKWAADNNHVWLQ